MKMRLGILQAMLLLVTFSIPAFGETVVACTSDGTLYVHVVGSDTVTVKNNGCQGGPWAVHASVAAKGNLQIAAGSADHAQKAVASLKTLATEGPSTTMPANSPEFQRAEASALAPDRAHAKTGDMKSPMVLQQSELPAYAYSLVTGGTPPRHPCPPATTWDGTKCAGMPMVHADAANVVNTSRSNVKNNLVFQTGPGGKLQCKGPEGRACTLSQIEPLTMNAKSVKKIGLAGDGTVMCDGKACTPAQVAELNGAAAK